MNVIALYTYGEIKEMQEQEILGNIIVENDMNISDDIYGLVLNNVFIPIILNGSDDYFRYERDLNCLENYYEKEA